MEICTLGGYEEVGKNMTAVKVGEDVIIFDAGLFLPPLIEIQEQEKHIKYTEEMLRKNSAIADDLFLKEIGWAENVRAIVISHAHLDHIGGLPYIASHYPKAPIITSLFTMNLFESIISEEKINIKNKLKIVKPNEIIEIPGKNSKLKLEFLHTTHSTIQCLFPIWHSSDGIFFYALDFKFDQHPILGEPPNYKRLKELSNLKIKCLVVDSLYSDINRRTASERIASNLLEDAINSVRDNSSALFITTFSSHIARLKSIVDFASKRKREIVFLGRSLNRYVQAAYKAKECPFFNKIKLLKYRKQVNSFLKHLNKQRDKFIVVCTGHQGEPGSILDRITQGETPFEFHSGDNVIFSSSVIPVTVNISQREKMDKKLKKMGVRIQTDVHVSGHGGREDLRDLIELLSPLNIIPAHGSLAQEAPLVDLATGIGYKFQENVFLSSNKKVIKIK